MLTIPKESSAIETAEEAASSEAESPAAEQPISKGLRVAIGSSFVLRLAGASTGLLLASYLRQVVHADANIISLLAAVFYATELFLAPVFGALSDLRGRKPFLVLGPLAGAVAVQIHPLTTIVVVLALGRLLEGLSTAANAPGTLGYLADSTAGTGKKAIARRGRVMGMYEISFVVGLVGGGFLGGQLWEHVGVNGFRLVSLIYLAAAAVLFFLVPESLPAEAKEHHTNKQAAVSQAEHPIKALISTRVHSYAELLREPALRSFVPAWLAINAVVGLWFTHIQPLLLHVTDSKGNVIRQSMDNQLLVGHMSSSQIGWVQAVFGIAFVSGILIWSMLYARMRRTKIMLVSIGGIFLVCLAMLGINNNILPGPLGQWPLVPLLLIGVFLESGFTPVALAYLADISETRVEHRGVVMGLYSVFLGIGQFIGAATGGFFIVGLGFNGLILATALLGTVAGSAVLWLRSKYAV